MIATLLVFLAIMLALTVPIAISIAICTLAVFAIHYNNTTMVSMLAQAMVTSSDSFPLLAIPFFMLVGSLMERTKIAKQLVDVAGLVTGSRHGGLGMTTIVAAIFFSSICGSGPATAAAIGGIMVPSLLAQGYSKSYTGGLIACASVVGPIMPPSIPIIMFGVTVGASITTMFLAGIVPGLIIGVVCLFYNQYISKKRNYKSAGFSLTKQEKKRIIYTALPAMLMPVVVLGGIYTGFFTPTESAVVGVMYASFVGGFVYRTLSWKLYKDALMEAAVTSATVMFILGGAITFGRLLTLGNIPQTLTTQLSSISESPVVILLIVNLMLVVVGTVIDTISCVIIFAPLFTPVLVSLGYHPVYIGVIFVVNLCISMVTPPTGVNTMVAQRVSGASFESVLKEAMPLVVLMFMALGLMILFPSIITFVPEIFGLM